MPDPADHVMGPECPSDSDAVEALTNATHVALPPQSSDRVTTRTTPTVHEASMGEEVPSGTEMCNYLTTKGGLSATHRDVLVSILRHTAIKHTTTNATGRTRGRQNREHSCSQQATTQPNSKTSRVALQNGNWRFCNMKMTASSTQQRMQAMKEKEWNIVFGQPSEALRSTMEARPVGVAIAAGPGVERQVAPSTTPDKHTSAPGTHGWRGAELQALPVQLFEHSAEVLDVVEETGTWLLPVTRLCPGAHVHRLEQMIWERQCAHPRCAGGLSCQATYR